MKGRGTASTGAALWAADGPVAKAAAALSRRYSPRDGQIEMAGIVEEAMARQATQEVGLVPIEASTGTGKTLGYLLPGAMHAVATGTRMLVSTYTIELGRQLVQDDGPLAAEAVAIATGKRPAMAQMRGRRHFLSPSRARAAGNLLRDDGMPKSAWEPYLEAARIAQDLIDQAGVVLEGGSVTGAAHLVNAALTAQISADMGEAFDQDDVCMLAASPEAESGIIRLARALATEAQVLVTTHAYTATCLARRTLFKAEEEPFGILVVDEADRWADAARSVSMMSVSLDSLARSVEALVESARHKPKAHDMVAEAGKIARRIEKLSGTGPTTGGTSVPMSVTDPAMIELQAIGGRLDVLHGLASGFRSHTASAADALREQRMDIAGIGKALGRDDSGFWVARWKTSRVTARPSVSVCGRAPGRIMRRLWTHEEGGQPLARTIVLTSATLRTPGFSDGARWKSLEIATGFDMPPGLAMRDLARVIEPTRYGTMRVRFADPRAPVPYVDEAGGIGDDALVYARRVIAAAMESAATRSGRTLVLVPSYETGAQLSGIRGVTVHVKGQRMDEVLRSYAETPGACLVTPAAWVGVNLPGLVQELVIPRIPFVPMEERSTNGVRLMSDTLMKLQQGIGRAIRDASDDVTVWFADPRMPPPECVVEDTGLLRHKASNPVLLATIPARFRARFGIDPTAAAIGVRMAAGPAAERAATAIATEGRAMT